MPNTNRPAPLRVLIPHLAALGYGHRRPDGSWAVSLDGEGRRVDIWHRDQVQVVAEAA